jgi:diaminopimelate epimerase
VEPFLRGPIEAGLPFLKGHGTGNDFVVLPDVAGDIDLTPELVRRLCDRRFGIGGDGVLRVVLVERMPGARQLSGGARWFMDYHNADGSIAETCGNGIRVFARFLVTEGLVEPGTVIVGTRAGERRVEVPADEADITVDMGPVSRLVDAKVEFLGRRYDAVGYSLGNPHLVVLAASPIDDVDLCRPPLIDPPSAYPGGVNVELVEVVGERHIRMRVHERGSGETRSCGTGACAAAVAAMDAREQRGNCTVDVPGGRLLVTWQPDGTVTMTGPAVLVASGEVDEAIFGDHAIGSRQH